MNRILYILCTLGSVLLMIAFAAAPSRADNTPWWDPAWAYRRTIEAKPPSTFYAGPDVGVVEFLTGGAIQPDGRDVRVIGRGQVLPAKVIMVGPGDRCLTAFEMLPAVSVYHVYYGNAKAPAPAPAAWEPKRGLLLEGWVWRGGQADTLQQALRSINTAQPKQGAKFIDQINLGWNPFGPSANYVHVFTGWLNCTEEGRYTFAISTEHAGFLLIDGQPVVSRGGWQPPVRQARIRGQVQLTRGLHALKFYHIQAVGQMNTAVVAWSLPSWNQSGEANPANLRFEIIPASAFAAVSPALLVDCEAKDQTLIPDYAVENLGKAWLTGDRYLVRYRFAALLKGAQLVGARPTWDFGDNTTSTEVLAEHIYLNPGMYKVTLTLQKGAATYAFSNRIAVDQDWNRQAEQNIDVLATYAPSLRQRDLARMRIDDLATYLDVVAKLKRADETVRAGRVLLQSPERVRDDLVLSTALLLAEALERPPRTDEALRMLAAAEERLTNPGFKARLAVRAGEMRLYLLRDLTGAAVEFNKVLTRYAAARDDAVRRATIRQADIFRKQGDREKAVALYEKAAAIAPIPGQTSFGQSLVLPGLAPKPVRVSAYARTVEAFLFEKKLDDAETLLDSWEWDYPEEKLKGQTALLRAKLCLAKGDLVRAAEEAEDLAAFEPRNPYVPEALWLAGQAYAKRPDTARAATAYQRLIDSYPESPLVPEARKALAALPAPKPPAPAPR
jgi:tetratricopeptide (TPR) repeat protein